MKILRDAIRNANLRISVTFSQILFHTGLPPISGVQRCKPPKLENSGCSGNTSINTRHELQILHTEGSLSIDLSC